MENKKLPEPTLVFLTYWLYVTIRLALATTIIYFTFSFLLMLLIFKSGDAVITWSQAVTMVFIIFPIVLVYSPIPSLVMSIVRNRENNQAHEPYRSKGEELPIYKIQNKEIVIGLEYDTAFSQCLNALYNLDKESVKIVEENKSAGKIIAVVKDKKLKIKGSNQTIQVHLSQQAGNNAVLNIESYSNNFYKGMDLAVNIKNVHDIANYLQKL